MLFSTKATLKADISKSPMSHECSQEIEQHLNNQTILNLFLKDGWHSRWTLLTTDANCILGISNLKQLTCHGGDINSVEYATCMLENLHVCQCNVRNNLFLSYIPSAPFISEA